MFQKIRKKYSNTGPDTFSGFVRGKENVSQSEPTESCYIPQSD